ncbi:hypothetical protein IBX65_08920 [Candidatus Aerophobetes bacterium]|nr:hypothetical protein [Candidatus Aerophobetes bacterium]
MKRLTDAGCAINKVPLIVPDYPELTYSNIREAIEKYQPDVVGIDYLQQVSLQRIPGEKKYEKLGWL